MATSSKLRQDFVTFATRCDRLKRREAPGWRAIKIASSAGKFPPCGCPPSMGQAGASSFLEIEFGDASAWVTLFDILAIFEILCRRDRGASPQMADESGIPWSRRKFP